MLLFIHSGANILPWWETRENRDHRAGASLWVYMGKRNRNYAVWGIGGLPSIFIHYYYFYVKRNSLPGLAGLPRAGILARSSPNPCLSVCVCVCVQGASMRFRMCSFLSATAHIYLFHLLLSVQRAFYLVIWHSTSKLTSVFRREFIG